MRIVWDSKDQKTNNAQARALIYDKSAYSPLWPSVEALCLRNTEASGLSPGPMSCRSSHASYFQRLHDALLTRLSNDDDMEKSLSTFANEMASSAMILGMATSDSLVLIDEVGRGTSPLEGVGISHAIAESLIKTRVSI